MATIYIDDTPYTVKDGQNLLHACLSLGFDVPYFCWHPALHSVGACRQCAVKKFKDENDKSGEIVMACMTPAADGTRISIDDPDAKAFRASVIEWLMINHPHDCPVCDEGGECHLQDMTVMTGHVYRRYRFSKRTFRNQDLGPFINHEMNRCIQCYRCHRFYRHYAGGSDLSVFGAHDRLYFGRQNDGPLENAFSGNLVEICPTGVFTDKTFKSHYTRKWDLQTAPSVCVHCGLGCNILAAERYGELRRIRNRYHSEINGYFLCDRGRFGYGFVNSRRRIDQPLRRTADGRTRKATSADAALETAASWIAGGRPVVGIGSPRAAVEANFALKMLVGAGNFYAGIGRRDLAVLRRIMEILQDGPAAVASVQEAAAADAVFVLGEDVLATAPMLGLALRQLGRPDGTRRAEDTQIPKWNAAGRREVIQREKAPLWIATPYPTQLDDIAAGVHRSDPESLARLGRAVARRLDSRVPEDPKSSPTETAVARSVAQALEAAERPVVVSGTGCSSSAVVEAAANIAWALTAKGRPAKIVFTVPECNSMGLMLSEPVGGVEDAFKQTRQDEAAAAIVLENDLFRRVAPAAVDTFFTNAAGVVAIDHVTHGTAERADLVLPAATFAEATGTMVNCEGRAQRFFRVFPPAGGIRASWRWIRDIAAAAGRTEMASWQRLDDVYLAMGRAAPVFRSISEAAPGADFRAGGAKIARQSFRCSGRTAVLAHIDVHEPRPPQDPDSPLSHSMEGYAGRPSSALIPRFWAPGWNSVQAVNKFQEEIAGVLSGGDPGKRLVSPSPRAEPAYFSAPPKPSPPGPNRLRLIRLPEIFGAEELSPLSFAVAERVPAAYIALCAEDAATLGVAEGQSVQVECQSGVATLPVKIVYGLVAGLAGLPAGLPGVPFFEAGDGVQILKETAHG
ncbi:MAG: NADH-quinone oxidoreductase subunit NuoG [Desulfosarcinaceae bacterium]